MAPLCVCGTYVHARSAVLDAAGAETMDPREEPDMPDASSTMSREEAIKIIQVLTFFPSFIAMRYHCFHHSQTRFCSPPTVRLL
jgi:hypothetical protein